MADFPQPIKNLVAAFERLPGIGPKSATRLAFYILTTPKDFVDQLANSLLEAKTKVKICQKCFGVSEGDICSICGDDRRSQTTICVVEKSIDLMALEKVGGYKGVYHVLGGVINPLEHVGPEDLKIFELVERIRKLMANDQLANSKIEIIIATNPTMEGEATALYIKNKFEQKFQISNVKCQIKVTRIGSGLPMGADLEYADEATLSRAMDGRREL